MICLLLFCSRRGSAVKLRQTMCAHLEKQISWPSQELYCPSLIALWGAISTEAHLGSSIFTVFLLSWLAEIPSTFPFWELLWVLQCFTFPKHFTCSHLNLNDSAGTNHPVLHCTLLWSCDWAWPELYIMGINVFKVPIHKNKLKSHYLVTLE